MKYLLWFVLLLSGCTQVYSAPEAITAPIVNGATAAAADVQSKTVALVEPREDEDHVYCSGVWVGPDEILTANHCDPDDLYGSKVFYASRADVDAKGFKRLHIAKLVKRDAEHDLLLLKVKDAPEHPYAALGSDPYVGEPVQTMGHPLGLVWSYSTGVVAAVRTADVGDDAIDPAMYWVQSTAPVSPGNSGGGLFDADGNLLGVCSRGPRVGQNLNLYVHVRYVRALLRS